MTPVHAHPRRLFIFSSLYGLGARAEGGYDVNAGEATALSGGDLAGAVLSFAGIMVGSTVGWSAVAVRCAHRKSELITQADYNARLPVDFSRAKIFIATWFGLTAAIRFRPSRRVALTLRQLWRDPRRHALHDLRPSLHGRLRGRRHRRPAQSGAFAVGRIWEVLGRRSGAFHSAFSPAAQD